MPTPNQLIDGEYNMPSIEKDGHQWIRMVDHIALVSQAVKAAVEGEREGMSNVVEEIKTLAQKFIDKVESGRARSKDTYTDMKRVVALLHTCCDGECEHDYQVCNAQICTSDVHTHHCSKCGRHANHPHSKDESIKKD